MSSRYFALVCDLLQRDFGFTFETIQAELNEYQNKFGKSTRSERDFFWSLLNKATLMIPAIAKSQDEFYGLQIKVYQLMGMQLFYEGRRDESLRVFKDKEHLRVLQAGLLPYIVKISISPANDCTYCKKFDNKWFSYDEAKNNFPFDLMKCKRKLPCAVRIISLAIEDSDGLPIMKE